MSCWSRHSVFAFLVWLWICLLPPTNGSPLEEEDTSASTATGIAAQEPSSANRYLRNGRRRWRFINWGRDPPPTTTTTTTTPGPPTYTANYPGGFPVCYLCGAADSGPPQYPDVIPDLDLPAQHSCIDLYNLGITGSMPTALCGPIQKLVEEPCGC